VEATLSGEDQTALIRAQGWRLRTEQVEFERPQNPHETGRSSIKRVAPRGAPSHYALASPPGPDQGEPGEFFHTGYDVGYHTAMEYRFVEGAFMEAGPAVVWMRMGVPLLPGETPTPLQRVLAAADSGNGVSAALDWRRYLFINVDLSVHLHRMPVGEWVCLDAVTTPEPNGIGIADTALFDTEGQIGRAMQTLLVSER
jgi:hypothetical protein